MKDELTMKTEYKKVFTRLCTPEELRQHYAPWIAMLEVGSTTFPERPGKARSECHAWSCAPICFLLQD